jgi:glycosyltransferase involved in cell wall biosynthesis
MPIHDLKEQIARLPEQPGVYVWASAAGETLYVGKARSLRDRVRSYLGAYGTSPRHDALLSEIATLEVIVTDSVMEALALGRPVLTTYVAGIPELVSRECGWLVPAGAVPQLTAAMLEVLDASPVELTKLGAEGQKRVREMHSAVTEATRLGELFKRYAR